MNLKKKLLPVKLNLFRDYEKEMREIEAKGNLSAADYKTLAALEAERNAKIDNLNNTGTNQWNAQKTDKYSGWNTPDYSKSINSMIGSYESAGAYNPSALDQVAAAQTARQNKASGTVGMGQYVNDDFDKYVTEWLKNQQQAPAPKYEVPDYTGYLSESYSKLQQLADDLDEVERPTYDSRWEPIKNDLADQALAYNYDDFLGSDTYNRLANRYMYNGNNAMKNTLGQIAARTGGLASSYAGAQAQQTFNDYMTRLEDMAYDMYNNERDNMLENANTAWKYSDNDYGRFLDAMDQYNKDRNFGYNALGDLISQENWARNMAVNAANDAYDRQLAADNLAYSRAADRAGMMAGIGDYSGYRSLGYSPEQIDQLNKAAAEAAENPAVTKPELTWAQTRTAIKEGRITPNVMAAYEYYMGEPYGGSASTTPASSSSGRGSSAGSSGSGGSGGTDYEGLFQAAKDSGHPKNFLSSSANYKKYGIGSSTGLYDDYVEWEKGQKRDSETADGNLPLYNATHGSGDSERVDIPGHGDYSWSQLEDLEAQGKVQSSTKTVGGKKYVVINWVD